MVLSETLGLWLSSIVREGIGFLCFLFRHLQFDILKLRVDTSVPLHNSSPESFQHGNITS